MSDLGIVYLGTNLTSYHCDGKDEVQNVLFVRTTMFGRYIRTLAMGNDYMYLR